MTHHENSSTGLGELLIPAQAGPPDATPGTPLLQVEGLTTTFPRRGGDVRAVRGIDLAVDRGRSLVVLGESGSGKSVTIRSILRLYGPGTQHTGRIGFDGQDLLTLDDRAMRTVRGKTISMVPQDPNGSLDPLRRVGGQIEQVLLLHGARPDRRSARQRSVELLALVGIPSPERVAKSYPHELSGGMRQRVAIAIAVACDPVLLLADEPTTALDVTVQSQILDLFRELQERLGTAMILVTHDVSVAADIADDVAVMYAGSIVEHGPASQVLSDPRHPYTRALLAATPTPDSVRGELEAIAGSPPVAGTDYPGCAFAERCPVVQDGCRRTPPALVPVAQLHRAACPVANPPEVAA